jgi:hypothetical protein
MLKRACFAFGFFWFGVVVACGDRTGLPVGDVFLEGDGGFTDALPMIDVAMHPDVNRNDCPDAGATLIYLITEQFNLYSFYPPTLEFREIGAINCPAMDPTTTPFSMAVDRKGIARIVYNDGSLYRVSTATAACQPTLFVTDQSGFHTFGMGYSADMGGPSETLYIAGDSVMNGTTGLARIDDNYIVHPIAQFHPPVSLAELTGTGSGDLYAFYASAMGAADSFIGQIDKQTGAVIGETMLPGVAQGSAWAFAFWGGDFYMFTSQDNSTSTVTRYRPSDKSIAPITTLGNAIVGAGVSTCAPQN